MMALKLLVTGCIIFIVVFLTCVTAFGGGMFGAIVGSTIYKPLGDFLCIVGLLATPTFTLMYMWKKHPWFGLRDLWKEEDAEAE